MSHYFVNDDKLAHENIEIDYYFRNIKFKFKSDSGVFSKNQVDFATDLLLKNLPPLSGSLLDLGCGYGCIGIVLGRAYELDVTLVDVNARALGLAEENAVSNGVKAEIIESDGIGAINNKFDTIISNPPIRAGKDVIFRLYEEAYTKLKTDGAFYIVIQQKHGAMSSRKKLLEIFSNCEIIYDKKGFYVFCCKK